MADEAPQHFAQPFTFKGKRAVTVDEESPEAILACVLNLLRTEEGWLEWHLSLGRPDWAFVNGELDVATIHGLVVTQEPRATLQITEEALNELGVGVSTDG